jgi:hypothetical protein
VYLGELDEEIDTDLLLQVMLLADHYEIEELFNLCDQCLVQKIGVENCILIYQHTHLFDRAQSKSASLECIIEYVKIIYNNYLQVINLYMHLNLLILEILENQHKKWMSHNGNHQLWKRCLRSIIFKIFLN